MKLYLHYRFIGVLCIVVGNSVQFSLFETASSIGNTIYRNTYSYWERCDSKWITRNITGLRLDLKEKLFGQPLVHRSVVDLLQRHLKEGYIPSKPLVLSFHGWPGTGKNYVSEIITKNIFREGEKSQFRHFYSGRMSFPLDDEINEYKVTIKQEIRDAVKSCAESLFIFDEIDKMPVGVFDAIKPFLDHHSNVEGLDFRKSIFIFLSNTGAAGIMNKYSEMFLNGIQRENLRVTDFEDVLNIHVYNEVGALQRSAIVKNHLVDAYIPFLPLQREHVKLCILAEAEKLDITLSEEKINEIIQSMKFGPEKLELYSTTGCKTLASRISLLYSDDLWKHTEL